MKYKRRTTSRRRTKRRTSRYGRAARARRANQGQRFFKHKMTRVVTVTLAGSLPDVYAVGFAWQQPAGVLANIYGFDSSTRWTQTYRNYEQFAVTGMKLKWIPGNVRGSANPGNVSQVASQIGPIFTYTDIDSYDILAYNEAQIVALDNNRIFQPDRPYKRYFGCKTISA